MEPTKKTKSFLEVIIFDEEVDHIHQNLGITDERVKELANVLIDIVKGVKENKVTGYHQILHLISIKAKHANELAYMIFAFCKNHFDNSNNSVNNVLSELILGMLGGKNPNQSDNNQSED